LTTSKQLYDLQDLDHRLGELVHRLSLIEQVLGNREALDRMEEELAQAKEERERLRREHRNLELTVDSAREKQQSVDKKLYGGSVTSPRELEDLSMEMRAIKRDLEAQEDGVLEAMMALERAQEDHAAKEQTLLSDQGVWDREQAEMAQERDALQGKKGGLETHRQEVTGRIGPKALQLYEGVRVSKGGMAVARVERGLCLSCSMSLSTHRLQQARSGREPVLCSSCGRILFVG
jgi:predicted  nucleic acid-binding Zn-ribbon protein